MDGDLVLLERWRGGDQSAGQELFGRHFPDIYRFFEHKLGAEADELAQATFLACLAARDQFRGRSSFRTYLFTIARHELYAHLRRMRRNEVLDFEVTSLAEIVTTPSSRIDRARRGETLRSALLELSAEQQLLLELHYWHDLDASALAEVFDASPATVRVRLVRARGALRERLSRLGAGALGTADCDRLVASLSESDDDSAESEQDVR